MAAVTTWQNRIIGTGSLPAADFLANEANWRIHPKGQQDALGGTLGEIGWIQQVIVNKRTSSEWGRDQNVETLVDGHLRVSLALSRSDAEPVPVVYVDLTPNEERLALATIDPLSAMAATDRDQLDALLREVQTGDAAVMAMLDQLAAKSGIIPPIDPLAEWQGMPEFEQADQMPHRTIYVHFADDAAVEDFARIIGQDLTDKTKYVWHPEQRPQTRINEQYVSDAT